MGRNTPNACEHVNMKIAWQKILRGSHGPEVEHEPAKGNGRVQPEG